MLRQNSHRYIRQTKNEENTIGTRNEISCPLNILKLVLDMNVKKTYTERIVENGRKMSEMQIWNPTFVSISFMNIFI